MKHFFKISSIVGLSLLLAGAVCFLIGWGATGFKVSALSNVKAEILEYTESETSALHTITVDYQNANVEVRFGGEAVQIQYPKRVKKNGKEISEITLKEENGELFLQEKTPRFNFNNIDFSKPTVVLTLPSTRSFNLSLSTDNGKITIADGGSYKALRAETDNGRITIGQIACENDVTIEADNGSISLGDFTANNLTVSADNGKITLAGGKASGTIDLKTDNGRIQTNGAIEATTVKMDSNNGKISVNGVLNADTVTLTTDNGNIYAKLFGKQADWSTAIKTGNGDTNIGNFLGGVKRLQAETGNGDIDVYFEN